MFLRPRGAGCEFARAWAQRAKPYPRGRTQVTPAAGQNIVVGARGILLFLFVDADVNHIV